MAIEDKKDRDTVLLTGLPVSDEMQDILERCADGKYVDVEEVKATPEMKAAESCVSYATPTIQLKDREAIENHVFETLMDYGSISLDEKGKPLVDSDGNTLYNGDVEKGRRLDIVIGLPASGKSSAIVDTISYEHHSMLIDNDEAKRQFPEFNKGWVRIQYIRNLRSWSKRYSEKLCGREETLCFPRSAVMQTNL